MCCFLEKNIFLKMMLRCRVICLAIVLCFNTLLWTRGAAADVANERATKTPTVLIVTLIRNKAHVLPYFFSYLEQLDYPKDRITLWLVFEADWTIYRFFTHVCGARLFFFFLVNYYDFRYVEKKMKFKIII